MHETEYPSSGRRASNSRAMVVLPPPDGALTVNTDGADLILGGGAGTLITYVSNTGPGATVSRSTVSGGAGRISVNTAAGVFLGGTAGGNRINVDDGTIVGGGDGDVLWALNGVVFGGILGPCRLKNNRLLPALYFPFSASRPSPLKIARTPQRYSTLHHHAWRISRPKT